jgi:DNA-binding MarR family transcriptional regulator
MSRPTSAATPAGGNGPDDSSIRTADAVYGLLSSLIRHMPRDLSLTSTATLATLNRTGPRRITDLAAIAGTTQPSVTALVSNLERAGFVERRSDPADKRVVLVAITAAGSEYIRTRRRTNIEAYAQLVDALPPDEAAALAAAIPALEHLRELDDARRDPNSAPDEPPTR